MHGVSSTIVLSSLFQEYWSRSSSASIRKCFARLVDSSGPSALAEASKVGALNTLGVASDAIQSGVDRGLMADTKCRLRQRRSLE